MHMIRNYPVEKPTSAPATGNMFYQFLMRNIPIAAKANHSIWYEGERTKLEHPDKYAFRGKGESGRVVLVKDLNENQRIIFNIPDSVRETDKVYNPNFVPYEELDEMTKYSNELASLSVPKSISSYFGRNGKTNYSERDVFNFLEASHEDLSSEEMQHILHGNHLAWCALNYVRGRGNIEGDIMNEFHAQNPTDFYVKDLGTSYSDESNVYLFKCTKCGHIDRQADGCSNM